MAARRFVRSSGADRAGRREPFQHRLQSRCPADPFGKLETPAFLADEFAEAGPEFAVAIGAALRRLSELE